MQTQGETGPVQLSLGYASTIAVLLIPFFLVTAWMAARLAYLNAQATWCTVPLTLTILYWFIYAAGRHRPEARAVLLLLAITLAAIAVPELNILLYLLGFRPPSP